MRSRSANTAGQRRPTVLLVDDELAIRETLGRLLEFSGYDVVKATDPDAAFERLKRLTVDALILDVRLPGERSGLEVLEFVRLGEDLTDVPVIVLTGVSVEPAEEDIVRRHRASVFYRPQGFKALIQYLDQITGRPSSHS